MKCLPDSLAIYRAGHLVCENSKNSLQVKRDRFKLLHSRNEGDSSNSPNYDTDVVDDDDESSSSNPEEICADEQGTVPARPRLSY